VRKATGWKVGQCRWALLLKEFAMKISDLAVMDSLAASDVGKFPPGRRLEAGAASLSIRFIFFYLLSAGMKGRRWELCAATSSPGGGANKGLSYSRQSKYSTNIQQQ